jgi:hypothetical protein
MLVNDIDLPTPFAVTKLPDIPKQGTSRRKPVAHIVLHTTGGYPDSKHPTPQRLRPEAASSRHCLAAASTPTGHVPIASVPRIFSSTPTGPSTRSPTCRRGRCITV